MSSSERVGVGSRYVYDGEVFEIVELAAPRGNVEVLGRGAAGQYMRIALVELLASARGRIIPTDAGVASSDLRESAGVILSVLSAAELQQVTDRAGHVREVLTGYRSGNEETAAKGEPRAEFSPDRPLTDRYASKARELDVSVRSVERWVSKFRTLGPAGLVDARRSKEEDPFPSVDKRWTETAVEVMVEHATESKPSRTMVIDRTDARVQARYGDGVVAIPSRTNAFRVVKELDKRYPTFRLSAKRNRDIAERPDGVYGKLRPTRPGEYMLMDTTRLDVFGLDPLTLRWVQVELTVAMDWYTRCITGLRLTPVSTKSVDVASVMYEVFCPRPAGEDWPDYAVWPAHGVPRSVLVDVSAERPTDAAAGPAIVPETLVVDHGKVYLSHHMMSVCQRFGISVQPARLRTGRDKGPVERFFRTIREDLLQALPGYKGPDVHSRGENPEGEAFFYIDELERIIREWIAQVYHHRQHSSLLDPQVPGLRMSPAAMFEHGVARAGYIEAPRDPDLAFEFLKPAWRKILHYGVEIGGRRYNGEGLNGYRNLASGLTGEARGRWPIHCDPDDITKVYFRRPDDRIWHPLVWEHAPAIDMPFSEDALLYARKLAASKYRFPNDRLAVADLLERWNVGLGSTRVERRIALRMARESELSQQQPGEPGVSELPSVARVLATTPGQDESDPEAEATPPDRSLDYAGEEGDDDRFDQEDTDDFYSDALEDV
ncbi:helix-turn-helix domain-containing protein [Tsukamurella pseudospumae]|uniref:Transposase n=1 Tax=Tsukamurella pseudospumae TaxID=239498 RepID=A0A137ZD61_9ACTN|nr:helix-turn-helix domain-containing protein [Tsukamurella pseudospumae]KXO96132.1 transposase [Tsukamurella pseudospumae]